MTISESRLYSKPVWFILWSIFFGTKWLKLCLLNKFGIKNTIKRIQYNSHYKLVSPSLNNYNAQIIFIVLNLLTQLIHNYTV